MNIEAFIDRIASGEDRFTLIRDFIDWWYEPFSLLPKDGNSLDEIQATEEDLGFRLPDALRGWYSLCGRRLDQLTFQDHAFELVELHQPSELYPGLIFYAENQGVVHWGILSSDLHLPDPPVSVFERPDIVEQYGRTVSDFCFATIVYEAQFASEDQITAADGQKLRRITATLTTDDPMSSLWSRPIFR